MKSKVKSKIRGRVFKFGDNVNSDVIIPGRYLIYIDPERLSEHAFEVLGEEYPDKLRKFDILVAGENFGCGSSREHAPWALLDFGIRCIIAPSFADIFFNNCFKNGILPIALPQEDVDKLLDDAERGANATLTIDLEKQEISGPDGGTISFDTDPFSKHCLLNGLDDVGLTLKKEAKISSYEEKAQAARPWV